VLIVRPGHLAAGEGGAAGWYDQVLQRHDARLPERRYDETRRRFQNAPLLETAKAAFVNAVVSYRPVYLEEPLPQEMIRPDYVMVPAGPLTKVVPRGNESVDLQDWSFPITPEQVRARYRRERGVSVQRSEDGFSRRQDPYERRLFVALLRSLVSLAHWQAAHGEFAQARRLYESILRVDPETAQLSEVLYPLGVCYQALGDVTKARELFIQTLSLRDVDGAMRRDIERRLKGN
jgi:tetratricopeptide (TPR) repeat protein